MEIIIKTLLIAWFITSFKPLQDFLEKYVKPHIYPKTCKKTIIGDLRIDIANSLSCIKCISFWLCLFWSFNPYSAIIAALIAYTYDRIINSLPMRF